MSGIICSECGRDIDALGQDNMSCTSEPLCEDCWNGVENYAVGALKREVRSLRLPGAGDMRKRNPSVDAERRFFLLVEQALGVHQ